MSERLNKSNGGHLTVAVRPPGASHLANVQERKPTSSDIPPEIPYTLRGATVALNARIDPQLLQNIKEFCHVTTRKNGPPKITLQDFITCALQRELERQLKRAD